MHCLEQGVDCEDEISIRPSPLLEITTASRSHIRPPWLIGWRKGITRESDCCHNFYLSDLRNSKISD